MLSKNLPQTAGNIRLDHRTGIHPATGRRAIFCQPRWLYAAVATLKKVKVN
jgi:hypothetical protein